ncbi:MAG TPA: sigma-70 family RNA polymerase sigma factor [Chitinophagaceae bacterium]
MKINPSYSSAELTTLLKQKNSEAYEYIFDKYAGALLELIANIVPEEEVLTTLEESFLTISQSIGDYDPNKCRLFTWLLQITREVALQKRKYLKTKLSSTNNGAIAGLIGKLNNEQQEIVQLHYLNGYSNEDIAKQLNISPATASEKIKTALSNLNSLL